MRAIWTVLCFMGGCFLALHVWLFMEDLLIWKILATLSIASSSLMYVIESLCSSRDSDTV